MIVPPAVVEALPALDQAGRDVEPRQVLGRFVRDQQAARREQAAHVRERPVEIARRVQDVGGHDHVIAAGRLALLGGCALEVEQRGRHERVGRELARARARRRTSTRR